MEGATADTTFKAIYLYLRAYLMRLNKSAENVQIIFPVKMLLIRGRAIFSYLYRLCGEKRNFIAQNFMRNLKRKETLFSFLFEI